MRYLYILIFSVLLIGCNGNGSAKESEGIKADPTKQIKTEDNKNTPPTVPEV